LKRILFFPLFFSVICWAQTDILGPGDLIELKVMNLDEMNGEYRVDQEGNITLPYLDTVQVKGKSALQAAKLITEKLKDGYLRDPQIIVTLKENKSNPITVMGAVKGPGPILGSYDIDLLRAISEAGGLRTDALGKALILRRGVDGSMGTLEVDLSSLLNKGAMYLNVPLFAGDIVNVLVDEPYPVFISGEIASTGEYKFSQKEVVTLMQVIAKAGGLTIYARPKKVLIKRKTDGKTEKHVVNIKAIQSGKNEDFTILPYDVIIVP